MSSRVPFAATSMTGSSVSPRGGTRARRARRGCAAAFDPARTSSVSAPIALRCSRPRACSARAARRETAALALGQLGRLDHADLGEQRDLDDEAEPLRAERELVVAQAEQRLVARRVVERGDLRERRRHRRVERGQSLDPVARAVAAAVRSAGTPRRAVIHEPSRARSTGDAALRSAIRLRPNRDREVIDYCAPRTCDDARTWHQCHT